jgi:hypothetical protein
LGLTMLSSLLIDHPLNRGLHEYTTQTKRLGDKLLQGLGDQLLQGLN